MIKSKKFITVIFLLFAAKNAFALEQNAKQWLAVNDQQSLFVNKKILSYLYSQLRLIDQTHPWQAIFVEGALGYPLTLNTNIWIGYRWTGRNPYNDFFQENRLIQQITSQKKLILYHFGFRTRLEEVSRSNVGQISLRLRQRFAVEIQHSLFSQATLPFFYDEIFFQLNHPDYATKNFVSENRLFLGFNFYRSPNAWWEIGYMNQYQYKTPQQTQNQMNHILSFTYNVV